MRPPFRQRRTYSLPQIFKLGIFLQNPQAARHALAHNHQRRVTAALFHASPQLLHHTRHPGLPAKCPYRWRRRYACPVLARRL
jgi:hypothetical protein